jgi:hypothetical protein
MTAYSTALHRAIVATALMGGVYGCQTASTTGGSNITTIVNDVKLACGFAPELAAISLLLGTGEAPAQIVSEICAAIAQPAAASRRRGGRSLTVVVHGVTVRGQFSS